MLGYRIQRGTEWSSREAGSSPPCGGTSLLSFAPRGCHRDCWYHTNHLLNQLHRLTTTIINSRDDVDIPLDRGRIFWSLDGAGMARGRRGTCC